MKKITAIKTINILENSYGKTMLARIEKKDPWIVLISTILSVRTRDETTEKVIKNLFSIYKNVYQLAKANIKDVEKIIKKTGFYRNKAQYIIETSKIIISKYNGKVPKNLNELLELQGVGRKVAGCVLVYSFKIPAIPVDTHVHRLSNIIGFTKTKTPLQTEQALMKLFPKDRWILINDILVNHGKTICKNSKPLCKNCKIEKYCEKN